MPKSTAAATLTATYNDLQSVKDLFAANKGEIAGLILEPVVGNSGFIVPTKEFLQASRLLCWCSGIASTAARGSCFWDSLPRRRIAKRQAAEEGAVRSRAASGIRKAQLGSLTKSRANTYQPHVVAGSPAGRGLTLLRGVLSQGLREICTAEGAVLCFDEVMTGFRIAKVQAV